MDSGSVSDSVLRPHRRPRLVLLIIPIGPALAPTLPRGQWRLAIIAPVVVTIHPIRASPIICTTVTAAATTLPLPIRTIHRRTAWSTWPAHPAWTAPIIHPPRTATLSRLSPSLCAMRSEARTTRRRSHTPTRPHPIGARTHRGPPLRTAGSKALIIARRPHPSARTCPITARPHGRRPTRPAAESFGTATEPTTGPALPAPSLRSVRSAWPAGSTLKATLRAAEVLIKRRTTLRATSLPAPSRGERPIAVSARATIVAPAERIGPTITPPALAIIAPVLAIRVLAWPVLSAATVIRTLVIVPPPLARFGAIGPAAVAIAPR